MFRRFERLKTDARGATAIEYGLILALVVLAVMGTLFYFGAQANNMWNKVANEVNKS